jgi:hypothetical protein
MEECILDVGEMKERLSDLRSLRNDIGWKSFLVTLKERMREVQTKVNDLSIKGEALEEFRVRRKVLDEVSTGEMLEVMIIELDGKITSLEEDDKEKSSTMKVLNNL